MSNPKHFFLIAGEKSGDLHGSHLVTELRQLHPNSLFSGVAGPLMRAQNVNCFMPMEKFQVMGFSDVIKALPALYKQFKAIRAHILQTQPDGVIFIDYPGFNLRMAKSLRKGGYKGKLIHYICPSVWAWDKKRIDVMADNLDLLLSIFPFEEQCFTHTSLKVQYVGNPLYNYIKDHPYKNNWPQNYPVANKNLIAIFPGSRTAEIERNLEKQLHAVSMFQQKHPEASFGISCSNADKQVLIEKMIQKFNLKNAFTVPATDTYELMQQSHTAIAKSGTVTLELALHKRPTVVVYELTWLNRFIAKYIVRLNLPHYCIVNIIGNKRIFPELIESGFDPVTLAGQLEKIYIGPSREDCLVDCHQIEELFQNHTAAINAASAIKELYETTP